MALKKPADLDLHFFQNFKFISGFILFSQKFTFGIHTRRTKHITCPLGQVEFSLDKYIMHIYLSLGKFKILLFPHPCCMKMPACTLCWKPAQFLSVMSQASITHCNLWLPARFATWLCLHSSWVFFQAILLDHDHLFLIACDYQIPPLIIHIIMPLLICYILCDYQI